MTKRKPQPKSQERMERLLEESKRFVENQAQVKRLIEDAKKQIGFMLWEYPLTFPINDMYGKLVCVYDQIPTIEAVIETLELLESYKNKVDKKSYSLRASTLINFIFWRKMRDSLEELTWEISELIMHEDIFEDFSAYEALAKRQRIPPRFLNTSKLVADRLRRERWTATISKGMRGKDRRQRKRKLSVVPVHETNRFKVLSAIKRVRSMTGEEQDEILNSKTKLAEEAGMSYHTLRRSETQGGWTTESLIAEFMPRKMRRADKK